MAMRFYSPHDGQGGVVTLVGAGDQGGGVDCLMTKYEPLVYDLLCRYLPDGARAAEVGSFKGGSACILWNGMTRRGKTLTLACHDLFQPFDLGGTSIDIEPVFDRNVATWNAGVIKVKGDSKVTHAVHPPASLDYCFIDGDHSYQGAKMDILNFMDKLSPKGWLVVQDCIEDVERAVIDVVDDMEWHYCHIEPPTGHHVRVFNRDRGVLQDFVNRLKAVITASSGKDVIEFQDPTHF